MAPFRLQHTLEFNAVWRMATPQIPITTPMFSETYFDISGNRSQEHVLVWLFSPDPRLILVGEVSLRPGVILLLCGVVPGVPRLFCPMNLRH